MSILNLYNFKSSRYNPYYLKLLPVASRERPPQATEFEDAQDIIINPINNYTKCNFNDYEVLCGLKVINIESNLITLSSSRILLNNFPIIIETEQTTIESVLTSYIVFIKIDIAEQDNKYIASYTFNTQEGYPLIQVINGNYKFLTSNRSKDYIKQQLFEIYGNFISWGLVFKNGCVSPGVAYINGNKTYFPYHTQITTELTFYRVIIRDKTIVVIDTKTKLDPINDLEIGTYKQSTWIPALQNKQIKNKDILLLEGNLNKLRDYLLETALLKPIDTTSNLITDTFNNTDNADINHPLFDCDIEQGNLILNKFSRITKDVFINNVDTNTKIINGVPNVVIQDYTSKEYISQQVSDSLVTVGLTKKGVLIVGPTRLDTSIYQRLSDRKIILTQTIVNAQAYGLTPNSSDFRLTIGDKLISTIITTNAKGEASFSFTLPSNSSLNDVITVQNNSSSATSSLYNSNYPIDTSYVGQTINIEEDNTTLVGGSIYIRKVNSATPLIKILLTKFNDKPQEVIAQTIINNNQITTSVDGKTSTDFTWDVPITLSKGRYSLLISSINSPTDIFISTTSTLANSYLFSLDANQTNITTQLNKDLKFKLNTAIYTTTSVTNTITVNDNIDRFEHIYYPGKFNINNIEYTNEAEINKTDSVDLILNINKYAYVYPVLISSNKTLSTYISKTIRTNFKYSNIYLELDAIILDSTAVSVYLSSNEGYTWEELTNPSRYLVDGNDQTYRYLYDKNLTETVSIINREGAITEATRNYLTIRIDLSTESNNKPIVKGYKSYVR
jgi:hypothetical protein